jgi:hypothetical protein
MDFATHLNDRSLTAKQKTTALRVWLLAYPGNADTHEGTVVRWSARASDSR